MIELSTMAAGNVSQTTPVQIMHVSCCVVIHISCHGTTQPTILIPVRVLLK